MYQGSLRLLLALIVVYAHYFPNIGHVGKFAVMGFFLVSGYLITRVVAGPYSDGFDGLRRFALNRFLRIYPTYWACALFSLAVILMFPSQAYEIKPAMVLPDSTWDWIRQFAIFGLLDPVGGRSDVMIIPVAWSLSVELVFYIFIALIAARSKLATISWFAISIVVSSYHILFSDIDRAYFSYDGTMIAFAAGALLFYVEDYFKKKINKKTELNKFNYFMMSCLGVCALAFWQEPIAIFSHFVMGVEIEVLQQSIPYDNLWLIYAALPVAAAAMFLSLNVAIDSNGGWFVSHHAKNINDWLANLSYPVFLLHWPILVLVTGVMGGAGGEGLDRNPIYSLISLPVLFGASYLIVRYVEHPVGKIRKLVRPRPTIEVRVP